MSWTDYGFPDPTFTNPYQACKSFYLAQKERYDLTGIGSVPTEPEIMEAIPTGAPVNLYGSAAINHLLDYSAGSSKLLWDWTDMRTAISDRDKSGIGCIIGGTGNNPVFLPKFPTLWAVQAKTFFNLLKVYPVRFKVQLGYGYSSTGSSTLAEAYQKAVANFSAYGSVTYYAKTGDPYGYSFDFRTTFSRSRSLYNCSISQPMSIEPAPDFFTWDSSIPAYFYVIPYTPVQINSVFDSCGLGLVNAGNATLYGKISLPYNVSVPASPDAGIPTPEMFGSSNAITLGMKTGFSFNMGGRNYAGADIYSLLDFYENEDTPA